MSGNHRAEIEVSMLLGLSVCSSIGVDRELKTVESQLLLSKDGIEDVEKQVSL